jgi:hypothetical protein
MLRQLSAVNDEATDRIARHLGYITSWTCSGGVGLCRQHKPELAHNQVIHHHVGVTRRSA